MSGIPYSPPINCHDCGERTDTVWELDGTAGKFCVDCIRAALRLAGSMSPKMMRIYLAGEDITDRIHWPGAGT